MVGMQMAQMISLNAELIIVAIKLANKEWNLNQNYIKLSQNYN